MPTASPNEEPDAELIAEGRRIAHDLNNVFAGVLSQLELAAIDERVPAEVQENLALARSSALRGVDLVKELHARCVALTQKVTALDAEQLLEEVIAGLSPANANYLPASRGGCFVQGDKRTLKIALLALAENILGGKKTVPIQVGIDPVAFSTGGTQTGGGGEEFVRITFQRPGPGAEQLSRQLFGGEADQSVPELIVASRVIAEHRGWIEVQGEMEQRVQLLIYLPRFTPPKSPEPRHREKQSKQVEGTERLLLVDDDETVRMVVRSILSSRGYQVVEARDGEEGVRMFSESGLSFDLVLMDLQMPRLNGKEALKRIRKTRPDVKVILLTGGLVEADPQMRDVLFLQKPFENQELARIVRVALDKQ